MSAVLNTTTKHCLGLLLLTLPGCSSTDSAPGEPAAGATLAPAKRYVGLEPMGAQDVTPRDPTDQWFHENTLTIRGDSVWLSKVPVVVYPGQEKRYSASDGGFFSYRGRLLSPARGQYQVRLLLVGHDYVMAPYYLKNPADSALPLSTDEKFKRGLYAVDSSFFKREYDLQLTATQARMDSVTYVLQEQ